MISTSDQICAAALEILEAEGAEEVSMRRVAQKVGITPMAIYHHFKNREALLSSVVDHEFSALETDFVQQSLSGICEEDILRILDIYVGYALERPRVFDYVFAVNRSGARRFPEDFRGGRSPTLNRMAEIVRAGMTKGQLRSDDAWEVAMQLWAHVHGYVMLYRAGRFSLSEKSFRALVKRSILRLLYGLTTTSSPHRVRR